MKVAALNEVRRTTMVGWHKPLATSEEAFRLATSLRRADTKGCRHCNP